MRAGPAGVEGVDVIDTAIAGAPGRQVFRGQFDGRQNHPLVRHNPLPVTITIHSTSKARCRCHTARRPGSAHRSEEHTSELPSLMRISFAVFCLKKQTRNISHPPTPIYISLNSMTT